MSSSPAWFLEGVTWPFAALKRETKHPDGAASAAWPSSSRCSCIGGHPSEILLLQALPRPLNWALRGCNNWQLGCVHSSLHHTRSHVVHMTCLSSIKPQWLHNKSSCMRWLAAATHVSLVYRNQSLQSPSGHHSPVNFFSACRWTELNWASITSEVHREV